MVRFSKFKQAVRAAAACLLLLLMLMMMPPVPAMSWTEVPYRTYIGVTGEPATITWDVSPTWSASMHTEARMINPERGNLTITLHTKIPHDVNELTFDCPKTGHWVPQVRACHNNDVILKDGADRCSTWATSITEPQPWWLFTWLAPPGPIEY